MKPIHRLTSLSLASFFAINSSAFAANPNFADGDLVLHAQQPGNSKRVYARLGSAALDFRGAATGADVPNDLNIVNIDAEMTAAFGANWENLTDVYIGVAAAFINVDAPNVENGDPWRTSYVSSRRTAVGTIGLASSSARNVSGNTAMTTVSGGILSMLLIDFENAGADAVEVIEVQPNKLLENHPFLLGGAQGAAYQTFNGGVQQQGSASAFGVFGAAGEVEFAVDLYRIYGNTNGALPGAVPATRGQGTFEGTVTLDASGNVSFVTQGVASAYTAWATTNGVPGQAANLDHDNDSVSNGVEYFLVGPSTVSTGFTSLPGVTDLSGVKSTTWTKAGTYTGVYGTHFWVETSTSLASGSWTTETLGVNVVITGNNVKYTFPSGPVKTFARLKVTGP